MMKTKKMRMKTKMMIMKADRASDGLRSEKRGRIKGKRYWMIFGLICRIQPPFQHSCNRKRRNNQTAIHLLDTTWPHAVNLILLFLDNISTFNSCPKNATNKLEEDT